MESLKVRGGDRYKKSFELEDFGFAAPEFTVTTSQNTEPTKENEQGNIS